MDKKKRGGWENSCTSLKAEEAKKKVALDEEMQVQSMTLDLVKLSAGVLM